MQILRLYRAYQRQKRNGSKEWPRKRGVPAQLLQSTQTRKNKPQKRLRQCRVSF